MSERAKFTNRERLREHIRRSGCDVVLACSPENVVYTSGFYNFDIRLLPDRILTTVWPAEGEPAFVVMDRRVEEARRHGFIADVRGYTLVDGIFPTEPMALVAEAIRERGLARGRIGYEALYLPAWHLQQLQQELPQATFVPCDFMFDDVRMVKTPAEIEHMAWAANQTLRAIANAYEQARPGDTERSIVNHMMYITTKLGADSVPINVFASGPRTQDGHHLAEDVPIQPGDIIRVDYGGCFQGYFTDLVRMAVVGPPSDAQRRVYDLMVAAHRHVIEQTRPGLTGAEWYQMMMGVHRQAPDDLTAFGMGHCIGLGIHDRPILTQVEPRRLEPDMLLMVEQMYRVPGQVFYHIEDLVRITPTGCEVLSTYTPIDEMYVIR